VPVLCKAHTPQLASLLLCAEDKCAMLRHDGLWGMGNNPSLADMEVNMMLMMHVPFKK